MRVIRIVLFLSALVFCECVEQVTDEEYALMPDLFHLDDFDRCLMLGKNALYCTVKLQIAPIRNSTNLRIWKIIQKTISNVKNYRHDWLRHGICIPLSCPKMASNISNYINNERSLREGIVECYSSKLQELGLTSSVMEMHCETEKPFYGIDNYDIAVAICFIVLIIIVLSSSFYEGLARYKSQAYYNKITSTTHGRIIACFSIPKNWERLKAESKDPNVQQLKFINGIRVYTMLLVVITHASMVGFITFAANPKFPETMTLDPINMLFVNGNYSMQMFMLISSGLLTYSFFLVFEKQPKFKLGYILYAFIHRYIRLTVPLIAVLAFNATWLQHITRGPLWDKVVGVEYRNCRKNWWVNLLYINNYYDVKNMCMLQTWYIAADTQLFIVTLTVLAIVWKYKKLAPFLFGSLLVIGMVSPGVASYVNEFDILQRNYPEGLYTILLDIPEWLYMTIPGHTNVSGCAIGLIVGYIFYKYKNKKLFTTKYHHVLWWITVWTLPLSVIFVGIPLYDDSYVPTRLGAAVYASFARTSYAFAMGVACIGFTKNVGWLLRDAIMIPPLQFLGRLTYCIYLVHVVVVRIRSGQTRTKTYMTVFNFLSQSCGDLMFGYVVGLLLCLFVEMPTSALQKLMMPKLKDETPKNVNDLQNSDNQKNGETEISKI
ncbi:hypothetical protein PPYR_01289 [Photinus pyralis]|uniref:Acyltransferase 3 domain-containing protein n=1 Tax=Photinus pyralis TaxID=7054 RepID=A0A1Y1M2Q0_PHOPY|nr:O-acyltransferase like protein-like [Photinus pyralis]KAB0804319.1 hypothetical protein PPYR_01289 [Photinus pyralis]